MGKQKSKPIRPSRAVGDIEQYGAFSAFGCGDRYGVSYYSTRRWEVPVRKRNGSVGPKMFKCFEDAVKECDDPDISMALDAVGPRVKAEFDYVDAPGGRTVPVIRNPLNGYAVGYGVAQAEVRGYGLPPEGSSEVPGRLLRVPSCPGQS